MLSSLLIGGATVVVSMAIQVVFVVVMIRYLIAMMAGDNGKKGSFIFDTVVLSSVLLVLFIGHLCQVAIWALVFMQVGEFEQFFTAFYHSAVNFSSLGYGDIVMSEKWRLLGALEAGNGVLMFGLSTGAIFSVMTRIFESRQANETK